MKISEIGFIYMITNPKNKIYIGSTCDFEYRMYQYKKLQCKNQIKLYNSLRKYGFEFHNIEIIWTGLLQDMLKYEALIGFGFNVLEPENLNLALPKLNDNYKSISDETRKKIGEANKKYKMSYENKLKLSKRMLGQKYSLGKTHSIETKLKMKIRNTGKILSEETKFKQSIRNKKPIIQYDKNMNFIKEWDGGQSASKELNINRVSIGKCCRFDKNNKTAGGYIWRLKNYKNDKNNTSRS